MFKNKLTSAVVLLLMGGAAVAQLNQAPRAASPALASVPPTPPAPPLTVTAAASAVSVSGVNPFVGKSLNIETKQRDLEVSKMETALLEEQIKQASLAEDMRTLPLKKQVEAAQATTARLREEVAQKEAVRASTAVLTAASVGTPGAATAPLAPARKTVRPPKAKAAAPLAPAVVAVAPPVRAPRIEATSVLSLGGARSAVIEVDGEVLTVKHGDSTPWGLVDIPDNQSIRLSGRSYKVHGSTLARLAISDPKPIDPQKLAAPAAPGVVALASPSATFPAQAVMPGPTAGRAGAPTLPPLQLPSGITLLPAVSR
jgi:hypothetical protein